MAIKISKEQHKRLTEIFELLPLSEKTLWKRLKNYPKYMASNIELHNDLGQVNFFRVVENGKELGAIKYYGGRKLSFYITK